MNFDQWGLVVLIGLSILHLTLAVKARFKGVPMPVVFALSYLAFIAFYVHLIGVVGK